MAMIAFSELSGLAEQRRECDAKGGTWLARDHVCLRRDLTIDVKK